MLGIGRAKYWKSCRYLLCAAPYNNIMIFQYSGAFNPFKLAIFTWKIRLVQFVFATTVGWKIPYLTLKVSFFIRSGYIKMSLKRRTRSYRNRWRKPKRKQKSNQKTKFGRIHSTHDKVYVKVRSKLHYTRTSYSNGHECFSILVNNP